MDDIQKDETSSLIQDSFNKNRQRRSVSLPFMRKQYIAWPNSGKDYSILEAKVSGSGLEEVVIFCKKCESQINLIGFPPDDWLSKTNK